ncbi:MAG: hypothetical protein WBF17_08925 [Phycisphaerae bacterium]
MKWSGLHAVGWAILLAVPATPAVADEIDDLADKINLRERFHGYKPKFHYTQKTVSFEHPGGPKSQILRLIMDGQRYVAIIADDHIQLLSFTPGTARTTLSLRKGRYHLDNLHGPIIPTGGFLEQQSRYSTGSVRGTPLTDHFRGGGSEISLVRASESSRRKVVSTYTFGVHDRYGYVIEGTTTVLFKKPVEGEDRKAATSVFCPNSYIPWPTRWTYDRTVYCPGGSTDYLGWVNNTVAISRADRNKGLFTWRDKGFIAYLDPKSGWSPCRTRSDGGPDAPMTLDHARDIFEVSIPFVEELPKDEGERETYKAVHRLFALPPELSRYVRDNMKLIDVGPSGVVCRIGATEDFEDQPVRLTELIRGLAWTTDAPVVTSEEVHSGRKAVMLRGKYRVNDPRLIVEPDIPQIPLRPEATYLLEAWFKVDNMTDRERSDYLAAYKQMVADLEKQNKQRLEKGEEELEIPEYVQPKRHGQAYIAAHLYETTPKDRKWTASHQTTSASGYKTVWQKVSLQFTTGAWDPFVHISIVCDSGSAFMDDFTLKRID